MESNNEAVFVKQYPIYSHDTDLNSRIRVSALVNIMAQSAIKSADKLGFGFDVLRSKNMTWMLGRLSLEIYDKISYDQTITVETWPKTVEGFLYIRDFIVRNEKEKVVARATTGWLGVDLTRKKLINVDFINENFYKLNDKHGLEYQPVKIDKFETNEIFSIKSTYFDIDMNKHVTATRYIDWMFDTFPLDFIENNFPSKIHVNYLKEIKLGDEILLRKKRLDPTTFYFDATNETSGKEAFRCMIKF